MSLLVRIGRVANSAILALGSIALASIPVMMLYDVVARYVFRAPTIWAMELSIYALQLIVFLPMGMLVAENGHIRVTLLTDFVGPRVQSVLNRISMLAVCAFALGLTWWGWQLVAHSWERSQVSPSLLAVPLWIPHAFIPLGAALLFVAALAEMISPSAPGGSHADHVVET